MSALKIVSVLLVVSGCDVPANHSGLPSVDQSDPLSIVVCPDGCDARTGLMFEVRNVSSKPISLRKLALPWEALFTTISVHAIKPDEGFTFELEQVSKVVNRSNPMVQIAPGHKISGLVDLQQSFARFDELSGSGYWMFHVTWSYAIAVDEWNTAPVLGGGSVWICRNGVVHADLRCG